MVEVDLDFEGEDFSTRKARVEGEVFGRLGLELDLTPGEVDSSIGGL